MNLVFDWKWQQKLAGTWQTKDLGRKGDGRKLFMMTNAHCSNFY
jgi:hypothetical protein